MEPPGLCIFKALTQLQSLRLFVELSFMLWEEAYSLHHLVHLTALTGLTELTSGVADQDFQHKNGSSPSATGPLQARPLTSGCSAWAIAQQTRRRSQQSSVR